MIPVLSCEQWLEKLLACPRSKDILAFYEHRIGAICCDPRLLLAPLDDHLVHRGDGVFETLKYLDRKIISLDAHLQRLMRSAAGLSLTPPCPAETIREIICAVARAGQQAEGSLRVLVGRGDGGFGIDPAECGQSSLYVVAYKTEQPSADWYARGLTACKSQVPVKPAMLARLKTTNYLSGVLMTLEARQRGVDVAFSFDADDCLAEAAIANVIVVDAKGELVIPEFRNALPGTTALKVAELAGPFMTVTTRHIPEAELPAAREILVLGTGPVCVGVVQYEGHTIGTGRPGPVGQQLRTLLNNDMMQHGTAF